MCVDIIQVYLVATYLLAYSHLTQNDLHSASYTIIISVLLLYIYIYIYIYICSKGITHNHKARLLIHNINNKPTTTAMVSFPPMLLTDHETSVYSSCSFVSLLKFACSLLFMSHTLYLLHHNCECIM